MKYKNVGLLNLQSIRVFCYCGLVESTIAYRIWCVKTSFDYQIYDINEYNYIHFNSIWNTNTSTEPNRTFSVASNFQPRGK